MGLFQELEQGSRNRGLRFIVIGGLAVTFHGFSRETGDLDLLINHTERGKWLEMLSQLGYTVSQERPAFTQLSPPEPGAWPVDLMVVRDPTFSEMFAVARDAEMYGVRVKVPSLEHLLALKLHAMKHGHIGRYSKDLIDVEGLVRVNALDLKAENIRQIFLKYGTLQIYEQISRFVARERP
jgi:predicted nucleotidyltransferase